MAILVVLAAMAALLVSGLRSLVLVVELAGIPMAAVRMVASATILGLAVLASAAVAAADVVELVAMAAAVVVATTTAAVAVAADILVAVEALTRPMVVVVALTASAHRKRILQDLKLVTAKSSLRHSAQVHA